MPDELDKIFIDFKIRSTTSVQMFKDKVTIREFRKNEEIFKFGKKDEFEYFLLKGILHRFIISEKGDMVTTGFYMPVAPVTPHFARTVGSKSLFTLQALTPGVLAKIHVKEFDDLRVNDPGFHHFGLKVVESELSKMLISEIVTRSYNAGERLLVLRKNYPNLENLIPHSFIASYLGITKVSFSRLRNENLF